MTSVNALATLLEAFFNIVWATDRQTKALLHNVIAGLLE